MNRTLTYTANEDGITVYTLLSREGYSDQIFKKLRKNIELTKINGVSSYLNTKLSIGDQVTIFLPEERCSEKIPPVKLDFEILFEDEDILVVNKPADMPIHPSMNNYDNSLGNAVAYHYKNEKSPFVYRCINRLDRNTTGITVIAKNILSASILYKSMKEQGIHRVYYGLAKDPHNTLGEGGTINKPIARLYTSTIERCIDFEKGDHAVTHYSVIQKVNDVVLVRFELETGRTHQIRVHMQSMGCPLLGDFLYNPEDTTMNRQALHAGELSFTHPITKEALHFEVPLPNDMISILN